MEIGVPKIDEQHKELVSRLNQVTAMGAESVSKEETQKTIDFLGEYIINHFGDEEALQKQSGYSEYEQHKGLHKIYVENFAKLKEEFTLNGASLKFTLTLNKSLIEWIVHHIKSVDVKFGQYYTNRKS